MTRPLTPPTGFPTPSPDFSLPPPPLSSYLYNLGPPTSFPLTTSSPLCNSWFSLGLTWSYAFHHEESARCFRYAVACDPSCAMAYWGIAYATGPNYNKAWERFDELDLGRTLRECHRASEKAVELAKTPLEKALAGALAVRFPSERSGDYQHWNRRYSEEMEKVYKQFGEEFLDVAALYADSLMALAPWELWDLQTGEARVESRTLEIEGVLERALRDPRSRSHPGVLHFYVHLMELSLHPEKAVEAADRLRGLCPDAGHLNHMPGHIDLLIGDYRRCIDSNLKAIEGDEKYMVEGSSTDFYTFYRLHNYTFPIYAAMFNGQYQVAISTVERLEASLTEKLLRIESPPMIDWMEGFKSYRVHILVRFGKWQEILQLPFPEDRAFYCVTTTILHYARALAFSLLDRFDDARQEQALFRLTREKISPTRFEFPNAWSDILNVAEEMLSGELLYRQGEIAAGFEHLKKAIHYSDNLIYAEPWGWMQPPRHAYAALQLEQGNLEIAAKTYAEDLGFDDSLPRAVRHPNNVWALHGYHECLRRLGRDGEARMLEPALKLALAVADVRVESSCFCRRVGEVVRKEVGDGCCNVEEV